MKKLFFITLLLLSLSISAQSRGDKEGGGKGGDGDFHEIRALASSSTPAEIIISPEELAAHQKAAAQLEAALKKIAEMEAEAKQLRIENFSLKLKVNETKEKLSDCSQSSPTSASPRLPASSSVKAE